MAYMLMHRGVSSHPDDVGGGMSFHDESFTTVLHAVELWLLRLQVARQLLQQTHIIDAAAASQNTDNICWPMLQHTHWPVVDSSAQARMDHRVTQSVQNPVLPNFKFQYSHLRQSQIVHLSEASLRMTVKNAPYKQTYLFIYLLLFAVCSTIYSWL